MVLWPSIWGGIQLCVSFSLPSSTLLNIKTQKKPLSKTQNSLQVAGNCGQEPLVDVIGEYYINTVSNAENIKIHQNPFMYNLKKKKKRVPTKSVLSYGLG